MLGFGDRADFDDPRREWRRLFSELLGTFALAPVRSRAGNNRRRTHQLELIRQERGGYGGDDAVRDRGRR